MIARANVRALLAAMSGRHDMPMAQRRRTMDAMGGDRDVTAWVTVETTEIGGVDAELLTPHVGSSGRFLYLHGGAYVAGSTRSHRPLAARLAAGSGLSAWVINYRLAPEHPFPAALDDACAAWRALAHGGPAMIVGDSAGGGLALATMVALRDRGDILPTRAFLASPWVDLSCSDPSYDDPAIDDPMLSRAGLAADAAAYLGQVSALSPLASPIFADLAGLPSLLIQCGDQEVLVGEIRRLAALARAAGNDCRFTEYPDMFHVWHAFAGILPEADAAIAEACAFLADAEADAVGLASAGRRRETVTLNSEPC
jgi:epsilon-lactone hydrolase